MVCKAPWLVRDGCKGLGGQAVGYWGRDINCRLNADNTTGKELAALRDEINLGGIRASIWLGVTEGNVCSCYKKTHRSSDRKCRSCHGAIDGLVPGYLKWGYNTIWMAPTDDDVTLTNVEITTEFHSSKVGLNFDALEGTIESDDKVFNKNAIGSIWEYDESVFTRNEVYSSIEVFYSLDSGNVWKPLSYLKEELQTTGTIRFKSVLKRDSLEVLTPFFEIVRVRYSEIDFTDKDICNVYQKGPFIKVIKTVPEKTVVKSEYGDYPAVNGLSFWTVGLSAFDSRIQAGSDADKLEGPSMVIEFMEGTFKNEKFILTSWALSDPRGFTVMTQTFKVRAEDSAGPFSLVW